MAFKHLLIGTKHKVLIICSSHYFSSYIHQSHGSGRGEVVQVPDGR